MKNPSTLLSAFVILIIGIALSIGVQSKRNAAQSVLKNREIELVIGNKTQSIEQQLKSSFSSIEILQYLFEKKDQISRNEFQNYSIPIFHGNSGIKAISWVPEISFEDRAKYESYLSKELKKTGFTITQLDTDNQTIIAQKRPFYFPVTFIEPFSENTRAIGYDIYSNKIRQAAINESIKKDSFQITKRIKLVQDTLGYGFLGIFPVHFNTASLNVPGKIVQIKGLISVVFKTEKLIEEALVHTKSTNVELIIFDVTHNSRDCIYGATKLNVQNQKVLKKKIQVAGREWELNFISDPAFFKIIDPNGYLLAGISITLLLFFLLLWSFFKGKRAQVLSRKLRDERTVRVRTEQSLSENEEYNRALFSQATIGLALTTMDGKLIDVNQAYANITGRTIEETLNLTYWEITPEKYAGQEGQLRENLRTIGQFGPYEKEYIHKEGHLVPVNLNGKIIERNGTKYILSSVEEITRRKQSDEKILKTSRLYAFISQINQAIILTRDKDKLFESACRIAVDFGKFKMSWVGLLDEETQQVNPVTSAGDEDGYLSAIKKLSLGNSSQGRGPTSMAIKEGKHFFCDDFETDPRMVVWKDEALKRGYRSSIALPITLFGKVIGAYSLYASVPYFFDQEEIDLLIKVSKDISFALESLENEKKKREAEFTLLESEERYRLLLEVAPVSIIVHQNDKIVFANPAGQKLLGAESFHQIIGLPISEILHSDTHHKIVDRIQRMINGETGIYPCEDVYKRIDGTLINVEVMATPLTYNLELPPL